MKPQGGFTWGQKEWVFVCHAKRSGLDSMGIRCTFEQRVLEAELVDVEKGLLKRKSIDRENS